MRRQAHFSLSSVRQQLPITGKHLFRPVKIRHTPFPVGRAHRSRSIDMSFFPKSQNIRHGHDGDICPSCEGIGQKPVVYAARFDAVFLQESTYLSFGRAA